jgi:hypothetical protein
LGGESGYLDHALASASLAAQAIGANAWHANADEPVVLDYNVEFKTSNQVNTFYAPDAYRSSDHDPVFVGLNLGLPPGITKVFGAATVPLSGTTSLSFTIVNPNAGTALSGVGFTDVLPGGLAIATPGGLTGSCGGGTISAAAGGSSISLSGATLAAGESCNFTVNVSGVAGGTQVNTTSSVTSTEGGSGAPANAAIDVVQRSSSGTTATGINATVTMTTSDGGTSCGFTHAAFVPLSAVAQPAPPDLLFPLGLLDFTIDNCTPGFTVQITIDYPPGAFTGAAYWKFGPTSSNTEPHWYELSARSGSGSVSFSITDGGLGDGDFQSGANGRIVDPGGPVVRESPIAVPTLHPLSLWLLAALLAIAALGTRMRAWRAVSTIRPRQKYPSVGALH